MSLAIPQPPMPTSLPDCSELWVGPDYRLTPASGVLSLEQHPNPYTATYALIYLEGFWKVVQGWMSYQQGAELDKALSAVMHVT